MTTATRSPKIDAFTASVRRALADLPAETIDELVDGLEADLLEQHGDDPAALPDPVAYADELRAAAGLAKRRRPVVGDAPARIRRAVQELRARHPFLERVLEFLAVLRPVGWVLRGWVVYLVLGGALGGYDPLPRSVLGWVVLLGLIVVSVQFGRGRWLRFSWMRTALLLVNVAVVIAAPFVLAWAANSMTTADYSYAAESESDYSTAGLMQNGNAVTNVFAYDAEGRPLHDVQLFDQDGQPLNAVGDTSIPAAANEDGSRYLVPSGDVAGRAGWNVYPLQQVPARELTVDGVLKADATPTDPTSPFAFVKPLLSAAAPTATPGPTAPATPAPTATPAP